VSEHKTPRDSDSLVVLVILARVLIILVLWLAVFLATFLGYFTVPFLLISIITAAYLISDLGLFFTLKKRKDVKTDRQEFIDSIKENPNQPDE